ncbi:hypothetical protein MTsPCn9_06290 [Croceitalea sp. MTPC9]|uniref:hypothetical protein n=1 Tax=unclassified Croceitalea TaxID=2632280 RepID=UPI002B3934E3|nr:hypothetical protein MTsPCn6_02420 [Croceitalea sp. MTPC6]GMN15693.1 hypothetical protein MTsPCn9_06290 [Croceitalea sp. MTPC9]
MAKKLADIQEYIELQNKPFSSYLKNSLTNNVYDFIEEMALHTKVYLFSGIIRNYFLKNKTIRDVDIVIESDHDLMELMNQYDCRVNSFGGYKVKIDNLVVDVWRMDKTWAINKHQTILNLWLDTYIPHTAFFNFSAVVFSINEEKFIYTKYFLRFLRDKKMDVVYAPNANYHLCVVNSFYYSEKYNLKFSKKLVELLKKIHSRIDKNYVPVQEKHFGKVLYQNFEIEERLKNMVYS